MTRENGRVKNKLIRIEDHTIIPIDVVSLDFDSPHSLLEFIHDEKRYINVHVSWGSWGQWLVYLHADEKYLEMCRADGICGICGDKLDPNAPVKPRGSLYVEGKQVCGYCGNILRNYKKQMLVDLFHELTGTGPNSR